MGNGQSLEAYNPSHVRIYKDLIRIQNAQTRAEMIRTLLMGPEYVASARAAGLYSHLLSYVARVQAGERPAALPGEAAAVAATRGFAPPPRAQEMIEYGVNAIRPIIQQRPSQVVTKGRRNEKAITYFQSCLQVLGLEEEVALTEDALKRAYKRAAVKAHPDKGGSEEEFEAVTRAHAYLGEILRRISGLGGGASKATATAPVPPASNMITNGGSIHISAHQQQQHQQQAVLPSVEPVRLNPNKLDLKAFNEMFEKTRIPDPDDDGYGDWLKKADGEVSGAKFSGKFNRDVFNAAFEEEARRTNGAGGRHTVAEVEAMTLAPHAVELGRGKSSTYTAAANASLKFTDLRSAYMDEATITDKVADVQVEARSFEKYSAQWKQAPAPLSSGEMAALEAKERQAAEREEQRISRLNQQRGVEQAYFDRMKELVIPKK